MSTRHSTGPGAQNLRKYYEILEIGPRAPAWVIKRQYRRLAKRWHPDRFASDPVRQKAAEEKMKAIIEAYEHIRDAPLRYHPPPRSGSLQEHARGPADFDIHAWMRMAKSGRDEWKAQYFVLGCLGVPTLFYLSVILYIILFYPQFLGLELFLMSLPAVLALVLLLPVSLGVGDWVLKKIWG